MTCGIDMVFTQSVSRLSSLKLRPDSEQAARVKASYATVSNVDRVGGLGEVQPGPPAAFRRDDITHCQCGWCVSEYDGDMSATRCVQDKRVQN